MFTLGYIKKNDTGIEITNSPSSPSEGNAVVYISGNELRYKTDETDQLIMSGEVK